MDNQEIRKQYRQKKKSYLFFHTFLTLFRCLGLVLLISMVIFVVMYSNNVNGNNKWQEIFDVASKVYRVLIPTVIILWIISKLIVVRKRNYLLYLKRKSDIIDEI